jgi:transcription elongation factor Elf1
MKVSCKKCGFDHSVFPVDEKLNFFSYQKRGDTMIVKRTNPKNNFYCGICNEEFQVLIPRTKQKVILDCLYVEVDFSSWDYKIKYTSEKGKGVIWLELYNGKSTTYMAKVWGKTLMSIIEDNDFDGKYLWTGELRIEKNLKDGKEGQTFCSINFNESTVNMREV